MSFFSDGWDYAKRVMLLDETMERLENSTRETTAELRAINDDIHGLSIRVGRTEDALDTVKPRVEEIRGLEQRVIQLEGALNVAKPQIDEVAKLKERVIALETGRDSDLARIQAAIAQLSAERSQLNADVERHIARMQREAPQLPPTQPTDN